MWVKPFRRQMQFLNAADEMRHERLSHTK